ncbi:MKRN2 opposite strand protein isoform X2 [Thamnophis elegans]|uniref:MKRN2 opposite strand protein isoform X2 n=1 Tax=Thamnophis elegans TaxID=35005 RepID=UPI0013779ACB|nr:MKRN2 opposite strand protein isoform X2 [Thamnophis elegans]
MASERNKDKGPSVLRLFPSSRGLDGDGGDRRRRLGPVLLLPPLPVGGASPGARPFFGVGRKAESAHHKRDYDGDSDLHVGITNTNGLVYNYNETGITIAEYGWEQCVSIPLVQPDMYGLLNQWDTYLGQFSATDIWLPHRYEECFHNCYTYALTFINCVLSAQKQQQMNKNEFAEKFVIPRTRKASKYITIYKEICKNGFYVVDHPAQKGSTSTNAI